ncbi:hypothetical protein QUB12_22020 [Microcoleus sp. B7-D4]
MSEISDTFCMDGIIFALAEWKISRSLHQSGATIPVGDKEIILSTIP